MTGTDGGRRYFVDNLRILCVGLLFPYHSAMIFNSFGERFYINAPPSQFLTFFLLAVYPWWMSGLFVLAGISAAYSLKRRRAGEFLGERFLRLGIPFLTCIFLLNPPQTYLADRFHNGNSGGFFEYLPKFFTVTDLSGSDGCFTTAHGWFVLYLFVISAAALPLMSFIKSRFENPLKKPFSVPFLALLCAIPPLLRGVLNVGGKSLAEFFACFLIGYFIFSRDEATTVLEKHSAPLGVLWAVAALLRCALFASRNGYGFCDDIASGLLECVGILAMIGHSKKYLDRRYKPTAYFSKAAFPIYLLHQPILVAAGYMLIPIINPAWLLFAAIAVSSAFLSISAYEVLRRFRAARILLGIK